MKIQVCGFSASGKSTFSKALAKYYNTPVLHLDTLHFGPNWEIIPDTEMAKKIDKFLSERTEYSRSKIQKMIEDEKILVNNNKISSNYKVKLDDEIFLDEEEEIEITDEKLLSISNGIVQGMSGSPIIQNNKLIGAVTHVVIDDPKKGYGIYIGNMLNELEN